MIKDGSATAAGPAAKLLSVSHLCDPGVPGVTAALAWGVIEPALVRYGVRKLPPTYETELWQTKCDLVFHHVFDAYAGEGRSIYEEAA